jgi:hypothetical protein
MSVTPSPIGGFAAQFFDNNGIILSGGKIFTYAAGTTTPQTSYTSASGVTPHANPIILDSAGRVPGGEIWLTDGLVYKFVIETATGILLGTYDNITGVNSNFVNYTVQEEVITATAGQTVFNLSTINYTPGTNSLTVYIDGVNQYVGDSYLETDSNTVTFTSGVHVGGEVKFTTAVQTTTGAVDASIVSYEPPFTGSVATNVQDKLAQYVSVKDFGAVGDGTTDDTAAIQAAVDAAENAELYFPAGDYKITSSIAIPGRITIRGAGVRQTLITCYACDGFIIPAGTGFITMTDITISQDVRFTTTPNTYVGISINGSPSSQCFSHTYRNVFVDGFQEAFYAGSVGSTVFDKCAAAYSQKGLTFTGQCLNNTVIACGFGEQDSGANTPSVGSYGIKAGDNAGSIEGLMITNNLIFGVERGIWVNGGIDILASNNILDMLKEFGFLMQSSASYPCINNVINGNYIAFNFAGSDAGVYLANNLPAFDDQNRGTNVVNNEILAYSGGSATLNYGILIDGTGEDRNYLNGNRTQGCVLYDCRITQGARHRVAGNIWRSLGGNGFSTTQPVAYINNIGVVSSVAYPSPIGVFTPTVIGTSSAGTGTYTVQFGTYKIIDNVLYFNLRVNWSAHTGTGDLKVAGLPVACANNTNYAPAVTVNAENITFPVGATAAIALINTGAATIELRGAGTGLAPTPIAMDASGNINISGFYDLT